jgi:hypothetical protein
LVLVDDRPEDLPTGSPTLRILAVPPYTAHNPHDRAFQRLAQHAGLASFEA